MGPHSGGVYQEDIGTANEHGRATSPVLNSLPRRMFRRPASGGGNVFSKGSRGSSSSKVVQANAWTSNGIEVDRVARMKMCSRCCRAKYCSKLCQVYDWRSGRHKMNASFCKGITRMLLKSKREQQRVECPSINQIHHKTQKLFNS